MKKTTIILTLITLISIIIILHSFTPSKLTGNIIKEQEKQIQFYFYDELTNCSLNGYIFINDKPLGKSYNGYFNLTYANYITNFQNNHEISIFGELGNCFKNSNLFFNKHYILPKIEKYNFLGDSIFNFATKINSNNPAKKELQSFIQPKKVILELNNININKNTLESLSEINQYLNNKIEYVKDWEFEKPINHWQTPLETLEKEQGDCEDFSTTLLSLFLTYNNSLNCYNLVFTTHITTFCYIEDYYIYYDQKKTELKKQIKNKINPEKTKAELSQLKKDYFEYYGINGNNETKIHYAFNDHEYIEFKNENEFVNWQYNLKNIKTKINLFPDIEKQLIENLKNLPEINLENGELRTQTISLPNSKNFPYFIIFIISVFLIILFWVLIKKIKK